MEKEPVKGTESVTPPGNKPSGSKPQANGSPSVRHASDEQFKKAQEKTSKLHAGLFRRLAQ